MAIKASEIRPGARVDYMEVVELVEDARVYDGKRWRVRYLCCAARGEPRETVVSGQAITRNARRGRDACYLCATATPEQALEGARDLRGHFWPRLTGWGFTGARETEY